MKSTRSSGWDGSGGGAAGRGDALPVEHSDHDMDDLDIPIPDDGIPWTPQGLAYQHQQDLFIHAMYNHDISNEGLLAIQPADGGPVQYVRIEDNSHYGGVTVNGDHVYVSGNGAPGIAGSYVQRYSLADLQSGDGETARPVEPAFRVATGSTLTTHGGSVYVARFSRNRARQGPPLVYEYELGPGGSLPPTGADPMDSFEAPEGTQGVTTTDGENFFFTQSNGFGGHSILSRVNRNDPGDHHVVRDDLSVLSQGIDVRDGQFIITNESSSEAYRGKVEAKGAHLLSNFIGKPLRPDGTLQAYDLPD